MIKTKRDLKIIKSYGFSLIEVMVAALISSMIVMTLVMLLGSIIDNWGKGVKDQENFEEARSALRVIKNDLLSIYKKPIGKSSFAPFYIRGGNGKNVAPVLNNIVDKPNTNGSSYLSFLGIFPNERMPNPKEDIGDIVLISYYVGIVDQEDASGNNGKKIQKLYRYIRGSSDIDELLKKYLQDETSASNYNAEYSFFTEMSSEANLQADINKDEPVAVNVVQFEVKAYELKDGELKETDLGWVNSENASSRSKVLDLSKGDRAMPHCIDIILKVVDRNTAKQLSAFGGSGSIWRGEDAKSKELIKRKHKTFKTRIYFND